MPVPLPSHQTLELQKSGPYKVNNPCHGEGQFELNGVRTDVPSGGSVPVFLQQPSPITNTGNVELTVTEPGG